MIAVLAVLVASETRGMYVGFRTPFSRSAWSLD